MPELPEVETIKRGLEKKIIGKKINEIIICYPKYVKEIDPKTFCQKIVGAKITKLERRGKYLIFYFDNKLALLTHLKMTGQLYLTSPQEEKDKHVHLIYNLSGGLQLRQRDLRKFGYVRLINQSDLKKNKSIKNLGPDPLLDDFTFSDFIKILNKRKSKKIKALLLDQQDIAGIGNIYADEILFMAKIRPDRLAGTLSKNEAQGLYKAIYNILNQAISAMGTSIQNFVNAKGEEGNFSVKLKVYRRTDQDCYYCSEQIKRIKLVGRSTHYCPRCQT